MKRFSPANLKRHVPHQLKGAAYNLVRGLSSKHRPSGEPNVFLFTMPRSGSTWLMELIWSQPGFRCVNEPLDMRNPLVRQALGLESWEALSSRDAETHKKLERYFEGYCKGTVHAAEPAPWLNRHYRPLTTRIVFKVIHGGEDEIDWFAERFNGRIVYFVRHPIPVSLSRKVYPRLETLLERNRPHLSAAQVDEAARVAAKGSKLERGVLDWCLQNLHPLRHLSPDWAVLSYEQLVLEPERAVPYLAEKLELPDREQMMSHLNQASGVLGKSDEETQRMLKEGEARSKLVSKWQGKVSEAEEKSAMSLLEMFELNAYRAGDTLPARHLWLGESEGTLAHPTLADSPE